MRGRARDREKGVSAIVLTSVNTWLDVVFFTLEAVVLFVLLVVHLGGNILTGRFKRRFKDWEWPHHEGPPIPFLPKYLHFQHVACMILLGLSGMYIRFVDRFFIHATWTRDFLQVIHYVAMIIVTINLVWRLWYAFYSKRRDYKEFAITKRDVVNLFNVVMYYAFIKPSKPHLDKYNIMQKAVYIAFAPMLALQALTGFALLEFWNIPLTRFIPGGPFTMSQAILGWNVGALVGDLALVVAWTRVIHYTLNWLFIIFTTIHVYLSVSEDFPAFLNFFGLAFLDRNHKEHAAEGHEGSGHEPQPAMAHAD